MDFVTYLLAAMGLGFLYGTLTAYLEVRGVLFWVGLGALSYLVYHLSSVFLR